MALKAILVYYIVMRDNFNLQDWITMIDEVIFFHEKGYTVREVLDDAEKRLNRSDFVKLRVYARSAQ